MEIVSYHRTFIPLSTHIRLIVKTGADHKPHEGKVIPRIGYMNFYAAAPRVSLLYKGQGVAIAFKALKRFILRTRTVPRLAATRAVKVSMLGMK